MLSEKKYWCGKNMVEIAVEIFELVKVCKLNYNLFEQILQNENLFYINFEKYSYLPMLDTISLDCMNNVFKCVCIFICQYAYI